ncbi:LacI family DNA-binding transcriptional regulator [Paracoccus sp. P2]|uniref:LacI family DNA-binding transcriptional regulator n=1 Tax=Paracoccus pantotrophus TaxID=82367 RepID=A0A1I5IT49_PARPN|nr:LacI family DNA-binding transcriptional regulator [Paracoccus pantotrophus]MDF3855110.1 LacI family DNA-binding transcriptional regulator [Paracoccus pantotrophus]QFG37291.1 LacI family DNA-binding transcriptional regulator [Paracoccus pantotrophus]QLH14850.1 LacI family DNA-binding transcriptional regulator [Paracoccus pantotrophus]RDD94843.1 LacI family DNA-binding transcriptional regulator [Paracoccus pantotrophus]RKS52277.1 LacI family transcriptional regulator [Paracoccus pantotrophus]
MNTKRPRRPLTLRDVSEASGVSEMTVSRVLRNRGDVSAATREKVLTAARTLGYVPNKIAGGLASQRVNLVAVVIPSLSNMVFPDVLGGISAELDDTGLQPVVGVTNYSPSREDTVLYDMLSWRPSGVILAGLEHSRAARAMLDNAGLPVVEIMDVDGTPIDTAVGISHRRAGAEMADEILAAGYRRIGFIGTHMPEDHRARKRLAGFEERLGEHGVQLAAREYYQGGSSLLKGREMTERILTREPELDFLYFSNDMIGAGGLLWCMEKGYDIPGRLGLAGFNGVELLDGLPMRLTTTDARRIDIGRRAARIVAGKEPRPEKGIIALAPTIMPGETIRKH